MPVYSYQRSHISKKTHKTVTETYYYYAGKYTDPATKERKQYKKRGFQREADAKKAERDFLLSLDRYGANSSITYDDLYKAYCEDRKGRIKERSLTDIAYNYQRHIKPVWGEIKLKDITIAKIMKWQRDLLDMTYDKKINGQSVLVRYSNEYLINIQSMFKTILTHGVKLGYKIEPAIAMFEMAKNKNERKKEMQFWHPEEFQSFINVVDDCQYKALFSLLYWCGLRIGEALALQWQDIDFEAAAVNVSKTYDQKNRIFTAPKTANSNRTILMPKKCREALKEWYDKAKYYGEDKQLHTVFGFTQPLDDNTIRRKKEKYCSLANVKNIRIHDFRHSHVSLLINQGFSAFDIAKRLGHTVDMVNNRYGHWFNDSQLKMIEALDKI